MWKYIKAISLLLPRLIKDYFTWIRKYKKDPTKYPIEERFAKVQSLIRYILKVFNVKVLLTDFDKYYESTSRNRLIVCNHLSILDPLILIATSEKPISFACKKEITKIPVISKIINILEGEYLDREDLKQQLRIMKNIENKLKNHENLDFCIFPEGTRNKNPFDEVQEFKHGTFRCATKSECDIVVVSMFNTFRILNIKDKAKTYKIPLHYLKTINKDEYKNNTTNELAVLCRSLVNESVAKDIENLYKD